MKENIMTKRSRKAADKDGLVRVFMKLTPQMYKALKDYCYSNDYAMELYAGNVFEKYAKKDLKDYL